MVIYYRFGTLILAPTPSRNPSMARNHPNLTKIQGPKIFENFFLPVNTIW